MERYFKSYSLSDYIIKMKKNYFIVKIVFNKLDFVNFFNLAEKKYYFEKKLCYNE